MISFSMDVSRLGAITIAVIHHRIDIKESFLLQREIFNSSLPLRTKVMRGASIEKQVVNKGATLVGRLNEIPGDQLVLF